MRNGSSFCPPFAIAGGTVNCIRWKLSSIVIKLVCVCVGPCGLALMLLHSFSGKLCTTSTHLMGRTTNATCSRFVVVSSAYPFADGWKFLMYKTRWTHKRYMAVALPASWLPFSFVTFLFHLISCVTCIIIFHIGLWLPLRDSRNAPDQLNA